MKDYYVDFCNAKMIIAEQALEIRALKHQLEDKDVSINNLKYELNETQDDNAHYENSLSNLNFIITKLLDLYHDSLTTPVAITGEIKGLNSVKQMRQAIQETVNCHNAVHGEYEDAIRKGTLKDGGQFVFLLDKINQEFKNNLLDEK